MPGLTRIGPQASEPRTPGRGGTKQLARDRTARIFPRCGNPSCRSGPLRLWRSRRAPVFEGRWACSPECLRDRVEAAIAREGREDRPASEWAPRIPLRLMLLEQGRISEEQLRGNGPSIRESGRLEEWLLNSGVLKEAALTRAISAQWNCPVFSLSAVHAEEMAVAVPPFLAEAMGALPVRVSGKELLYLAFSGRIDRSLIYAVERMTGLRVAAGIAGASEFSREQERFLSGRAPGIQLLEADDRRALAQRMVAWMEEQRPVEARLARVHELWWLRIWHGEAGKAVLPDCATVEDLMATVGPPVEKSRGLEENAVPPIRNAGGSGASCRE